VLYAKPDGSDDVVPIDTSAIASSEWLSAEPGLKTITLSWRDSVPWSNVSLTRPWHLIYRAVNSQSEEDLVLYDSVNVALNGFNYVDEPLEDNVLYSYRIKTRGTYGNPAIALQENSSQTIFSYPANDLLPCKPIVSIVLADCEKYLATNTCDEQQFENTLHWSPDLSEGCRIDIQYYKVYVSAGLEGEYPLLSTLTDTVFTEKQLTSFARCYRISAVDRLGQESPLSDPVCNDNCPYFELPNVFTPNGDGCNDLFSAYDDPIADGPVKCTVIDATRCPRFVSAVKLRVYNRWGREVYTYTSGNGNSIYINWDGRDNKRSELEGGVYFYHADVTFNTLDPDKKRESYKGWVHLVR